jgi:ribosomal protein S18 acetylase RimI-like enzyme
LCRRFNSFNHFTGRTMSPNVFPTTIRNIRDDEYETIGRLHAEAVVPDAMIQLIWAKVDPKDKFQWLWIEGAKAGVAKGNSAVIVMERSDTNEIIGVAWTRTYTLADPPAYPDAFPQGFNIKEFDAKEKPALAWLRGLAEFGSFLCKLLRLHHLWSHSADPSPEPDLSELAIAPSYQSQGFGKQLLLEVIEYAKAQGLNIALTGASGLFLPLRRPRTCLRH